MKTAIQFFKVLGPDYKSCNGGILDWPLPTENKPGKWVSVSGDLKMCQNGIHLTTTPLTWRKNGARLYIVEHGNEYLYESGDKACFRRVRLIKEITLKDKFLLARPDLYLFIWWGAKERGEIKKDINLSRANLSGADLSGANLSWADLSRADLSGANLSGANLSWADLSRADLSGANLSRAGLSRANLSGADLIGAYRPQNPPLGYTVNQNGYLVENIKRKTK